MSNPISKPTGIYQRPLEGPIQTCPHCNRILNQHAAAGSPGIESNALSIPASGVVDLFGPSTQVDPPVAARSPTVNTPVIVYPPAIAPEQHLIDSGDVFVPSTKPMLLRQTEHIQSKQARPEKALGHVIPGMTPKEAPAAVVPPQHGQSDALHVLDNPIIGGKVTIVVCCYGKEHEALHRRCLNSIAQTVPPSRMDLRIISNQVGTNSTNFFNSLPVTKIYTDYKNRRKYPGMRQVFWDPDHPINTKYVIWFDDDSYARNEAWLSILSEVIVSQKPQERVGMYGYKMFHPLKHQDPKKDPRIWFRNANWFCQQPFRNKQGRGVPNGDKIHFCVGGFWAISMECLKTSDIPDARLNHNGGDICIGEQVYQNGFKMKQFNESKQYIHTSAAPRRGFKEKFPWYK